MGSSTLVPTPRGHLASPHCDTPERLQTLSSRDGEAAGAHRAGQTPPSRCSTKGGPQPWFSNCSSGTPHGTLSLAFMYLGTESLFKNPFAKIARCKPGSGLPCCVFVSHKVTWSVGKPLGLHPAQVQRRQPLTLLSFSGRRWMEVIRSATSSTSRAHVLSHRESHGY